GDPGPPPGPLPTGLDARGRRVGAGAAAGGSRPPHRAHPAGGVRPLPRAGPAGRDDGVNTPGSLPVGPRPSACPLPLPRRQLSCEKPRNHSAPRTSNAVVVQKSVNGAAEPELRPRSSSEESIRDVAEGALGRVRGPVVGGLSRRGPGRFRV